MLSVEGHTSMSRAEADSNIVFEAQNKFEVAATFRRIGRHGYFISAAAQC